MKRRAETNSEFDAYSATYNAALNDAVAFSGLKADLFIRAKAAYLLDIMRGHFGRIANLRLLDVGCGIGNYHSLLADHVGKIDGVDTSNECIAEAQRRHRTFNYQSYDGERLPFENGTFDVVFAVCVIHHVPPARWPLFVAEMRRALAPGGLAVVFEHNPRNPLTRRVVSNCTFDKDTVLLNRGDMRTLMSAAGFRDLKSRYILTIPPTNATLRRLDLALGALQFGAQYYVSATA